MCEIDGKISFDEHFFAITLEGKNDSKTWNPEEDNNPKFDNKENIHKLLIKQIILGPKAVDGEINIIEAKSATSNNSVVSVPIGILKAGASNNNQILVDLTFPESPVTFKLINGNGPIHITGYNVVRNFTSCDKETLDNSKEINDSKLGSKLGRYIAKKLESTTDFQKSSKKS